MEYRIVALETLEANLIAPTQNLPKEIIFQFEVNLEHRWNTNDNILIVVTSVSIYTDKKENILAKFKANTVYSIEGLASHVDEANKKLNLPTDFILDLNETAISTTRGSLFSFLKGTYLHSAVLPIINQTIPV